MKLVISLTFVILSFCATLPAVAQGSKPSDTYKQFLARCYWAKQLTDMTPYLCATWRDHAESLTGVERQNEFKRLKNTYVAKFRLIKEEVIEDRAFIEGEGIAASGGRRCQAHVRVQMIRDQGGTWKILYTHWASTVKGK
jgi:hypothetical protein